MCSKIYLVFFHFLWDIFPTSPRKYGILCQSSAVVMFLFCMTNSNSNVVCSLLHSSEISKHSSIWSNSLLIYLFPYLPCHICDLCIQPNPSWGQIRAYLWETGLSAELWARVITWGCLNALLSFPTLLEKKQNNKKKKTTKKTLKWWVINTGRKGEDVTGRIICSVNRKIMGFPKKMEK